MSRSKVPWKRVHGEGWTDLSLDLGLVILDVNQDEGHPKKWFRWYPSERCGIYKEMPERYPTEEKACRAAERWAIKQVQRMLAKLPSGTVTR
jgi:hypothetical protein